MRRRSATQPLPPEIRPMLASSTSLSHLPDGDEWAFEMKWDGFRALCHVDAAGSHLYSRNDNELDGIFPELRDALCDAVTSESALLDGEIVAIDRNGQPDFGELQKRIGIHSTPGRAPSAVHIMLFDILELDGRSTISESYSTRHRRLETVIVESDRVHVPAVFYGDRERAVQASKDLGAEGVVAKKTSSPYTPGARSRTWVKAKHVKTQEVVVAGWTPLKKTDYSAIGALILGIPSEKGLRYVGRVGTGFSESERSHLVTQFQKLTREDTALRDIPKEFTRGARWIEPKLVGEVTFLTWTSDGILRQPVWRGWRPDKEPGDIREE